MDLDYLQPDCEMILEQQRKGYFRNELWTEYCSEASNRGKKAYKLSRFNEIISDYRSKHDISFTMHHVPGLEGQADWTGDKGHFLDCDTGELVEVHVFVMTLPYSGYFYCEGFLDEKMAIRMLLPFMAVFLLLSFQTTVRQRLTVSTLMKKAF